MLWEKSIEFSISTACAVRCLLTHLFLQIIGHFQLFQFRNGCVRNVFRFAQLFQCIFWNFKIRFQKASKFFEKTISATSQNSEGNEVFFDNRYYTASAKLYIFPNIKSAKFPNFAKNDVQAIIYRNPETLEEILERRSTWQIDLEVGIFCIYLSYNIFYFLCSNVFKIFSRFTFLNISNFFKKFRIVWFFTL